MATPAKNTICLWYDGGAEDAARFYAETFPDSSVAAVHRMSYRPAHGSRTKPPEAIARLSWAWLMTKNAACSLVNSAIV